ncbi:MAG: carbon-nitrogen hydrolase [Thermoguttaceae bacterium]|nr:carbon-nitrogen hydrolase [Thermoguttaceae bacterium]MDW8036447.1 carbon-nitrogen hydrolase [Thermoguttaceae bacterium]
MQYPSPPVDQSSNQTVPQKLNSPGQPSIGSAKDELPDGSGGSNQVRIALIQMRCSPSKEENILKALDWLAEAARQGAQIICLPELFHSLYPCQSEDHRRFAEAEPVPGPTTERLAEAAKQLGVVIVGSIFERRTAGLYHNTAVVLDADGRLVGLYRKMHIPDDPRYYEKFYFTPGDLGFRSFDTQFARIGVCVCWDQWFPEAARLTALTGAEILFYPTAIGWLVEEKAQFGQVQHSAWETIVRSHAIANGLFVAAVNRTGLEEGIEFWGASFVADPLGQLLARASHDQEQILLADCQLAQIELVRTHWPFLRDRRIDAYADLQRRFRDNA